MKIYQYIAQRLNKYEQAVQQAKPDASEILDDIESWVREHGPSGSGCDHGTRMVGSHSNRVVFDISFHHMKDGYYTRWTNHKLILTPDLALEYSLHITGPDHEGIKEYLHDLFSGFLDEEIKYRNEKWIPASMLEAIERKEAANG